MNYKHRTNHTFFTDEEVKQFAEVYAELIKSKGVEMVKTHALSNFINNASVNAYDLTTESWLIALLSFLEINGYEIKKKDA